MALVDCSLLLRHDELLGDRRQRFFFAERTSAGKGPGCLRKPMRLYGYTFCHPSTGGPKGRRRFDPEDRDLDRTS
jgi:hypothetical protein